MHKHFFTKTDDIYSIFILVYFQSDEQRIKETVDLLGYVNSRISALRIMTF